MTFVLVLLGTLLGFGLVVALILLWARRKVLAQRAQNTDQMNRQAYLSLAAHAAADSSGRSLVKLLNALDTAPVDCPVTVNWLRRLAADKPPGMLVTITWDGNEWRRVMDWDAFRAQLRAITADEPDCGARVQRLLADLEAHP